MLDEHYIELAQHVDDIIRSLEAHPDEGTRAQIVALLEGLDLLHREGLVRLVEALQREGAGAAVERATEQDGIVRILLGLYDLAELEDAAEEPTAPAPVSFIPAQQVGVRRAGKLQPRSRP